MKVREAGCLDQTNLSTLCPPSVSAVWLTQTDQSPFRDHGCFSFDSLFPSIYPRRVRNNYFIISCKLWSDPLVILWSDPFSLLLYIDVKKLTRLKKINVVFGCAKPATMMEECCCVFVLKHCYVVTRVLWVVAWSKHPVSKQVVHLTCIKTLVHFISSLLKLWYVCVRNRNLNHCPLLR